VKAEDVASILRCAECGAVWLPADEERWRAYLDCDDEVQVPHERPSRTNAGSPILGRQ
jgi:hypothetical protein